MALNMRGGYMDGTGGAPGPIPENGVLSSYSALTVPSV